MKNTILIIVALAIFQIANSQEILTLEKAIEITLEKNYDIKISKNKENIAVNNKSILNTGFLPTLSTSAAGNYSIKDTEVELNTGQELEVTDVNSVSYNASVTLSYTLFNGLSRLYNVKKFKEQHKLSKIQTAFVIENSIFQVINQYYVLAQQYQTIENLDHTLKISSKRLIQAQYSLDYGQSSKLEILNAEVDFNLDSINLMNASVQLENAKVNLNQLMGTSINFDYVTETNVELNSNLNYETLTQDAMENNKSLNQYEKNILLNQFDIKIANSNWMPKLSVNGSYAFSNSNNDANSGFNSPLAVNFSNTFGPSAQLSLSWNLFDGGKTMTNVQNAKILMENNETELASQKLKVERDMKVAFMNYQNTLAVLAVQSRNIETNKVNFVRTEEKYKIGQVNSIYFRQAQINLLNAENSISIAKFNAKIAESNLLRLSGKLIQ
ncbi:MAG: outer membrane protein [Planctomycetota bacterium]|jgi:outer membrane protein